ncbi:hypothetical protein CLAFUW4_01385 [Fulvia fulva]|uniref:SWI5-dependent HO expression protein 3 n=1 Tax=Passalora fulva TaxID=5499 RepID=A0A9Q8L8I2_PASFU|nr:uncharacterized protein CLAFUR5_01387 [Fulvia fulva]KAK4636335.1 hypothetical protein CLAFUR4_01386 [Fulvia fulva]KAK4638416.1 hypothetical protein CLAFUR0_01387 [Fulvia fulva]UJO12747.1 hypothetical protein CLAFUR5_01387 [Fulvia fulva]WPV09842.1 hypothetical protein CLAFUW4_01385 [Fulvia fulva]WPV23147.1 hypothetical protein CLAFUW7_01390 [Fulvia fulva]
MTAFQVYSTPPGNSPPAPNGTLLSPSQQNTRRTSGVHSNADSSPLSNGGSQNVPSSPLSPASNGQWSSAVGHAGTGKSGRVIEKLMAENDKLKRELKEQMVKAEEFQRNLQTVKPQMGALQAEIDNLSHAKGVDRSLLARRDRQIKELKDELAEEKKNRQAATLRMQQIEAARDEAVELCDTATQRAVEETKHATNHAEILRTSYNQKNTVFERQIANAAKEQKALHDAIARDQQTISRLSVVTDQMRQEAERNRKLQEETLAQWVKLQEESKAQMSGLQHQTDAENEKTRKLSVEMDKVVDQMRWVMGIKKNTGLDSSN